MTETIKKLVAPIASKSPKELIAHNDIRIDNYYWLRERDDQKVIDYLNAENAYTEEVMAHTKPFQEALYTEIKGRIKEKDESLPYKSGEYFYYTRFEEGGEYPIYCRKKGTLEAPEEIMLDVNKMAKGKNYYHIGGLVVSNNAQILAYGEDKISRRNYTLRFKDLLTGKLFPEKIKNTEGGAYAWAIDNKTVFYVRRDTKTLRSYQVWRHTLGSDARKDKLVYEEKDESYYTYIGRSKSKDFIYIYLHSTLTSEQRFVDAHHPTNDFLPILPRERDHLYSAEDFDGKFYISTNWEAKNFRLMEVPIAQSQDKTQWKELIAHRPDVLLEGIEIFRQYLVISERKEGLLQLRIKNWANQTEHYLDFGEPAYAANVGVNRDYETTTLRYTYTSLTTPFSTFDYDMLTREKMLKKEQEVVGGYDKTQYVTERLWVTARDGVRIPISIVYKKGLAKNGSAPLLQYAYGSYGHSMDPAFSAARLSLLDRGFAYTICHIRGGQEMGRLWYEDGKLLKKMNTFNDFIDCSIFLIENKWTAQDKLFAMGGSAGGLLMGAIINMRPDLYKGIIAVVPFVDVVTTMLDSTIPLTTNEYDEWGNPNQKEYYEYMKAYSPYDQVKAQNYPNLLITTGLHDSQVQYWEPAKWIAKLREFKTDKNVLLMHCDMEAGHGGASGRFKYIKDIARQYAFIFDLMKIEK